MFVQKTFFQAMTTKYKEDQFRYLGSFPQNRAEEGFTLELVQNGWTVQQGSVLWNPWIEEQLMERSRTGKACVLALALGWMDKKKPLAEKGERWLIMWNWEEIHYSYAISRWLAFSERHLLLVVLLAFAAHTVFWIEVLNNYFSAWLRKLVIAP